MAKKNQQKTWQVVARLVIVVLLVLGLVGSLFLGFLSSAYSLALPEVRSTTLLEQAATEQPRLPSGQFQLQPGDLVDGKPAEEYAGVTDDMPTVEAPMAALCTRDGRLLFERNIDQQVPMASTTKMMTAIIAIETTSLETPLTVTHGAANTEGTSAGLEAGSVISMLDCLYALLLPSGNDAAVVIAENISGMQIRFVELMNAKAAELGMSSTLYADASGLSDEGHYTTVRDYLLLTRYCMSNPTFRTIVNTHYYEANVSGTIKHFVSTSLLGDYLTGAEPLGVKTGSTDAAGYCFVGAGTAGGIELYTVVFNTATPEQRFIDTASMLEWGFRHYRTIELINSSQQVAEVALSSWIDKTVAAYAPAAVRSEIFDLNGTITQEITISDIEGEATKGQYCGQIIWMQGGEVLSTSEVVVAETVLAPDFWEGLGIGWQRFWGGIFGGLSTAETTILLKNELSIPAASPQVQP